ncbi:winged helix-turn-helix transcriptional regulator [Candidatus Woesearchaeota archaeon]|nr:winged helix-turn-helix transcriptional regulator [Candidatus Woesearchaeota archaeon]
MKKQDLVLMSYLRQNSRMSLTNLSKKTGIPISSIFDRLKKANGTLIQKHVSLLDFGKLGFSVKVSILLKVGKQEKEKVKDALVKFFNVNSLCKVNNGYDFLVEAIFHDLKELEDFFDALDKKFTIRKREVYYIIEDLKKEGFLSDPQLLSYVMPAY